ncbi:hypothetical protein Dda_4691 [Drechslerella dactyloides]|uniref:Uncharacterized protein n=1 Tax=Drechslerella dactyloides TaxID=74499 RepID=A0AAD6IXE1_DREDA|nr:hypothetical protein Dda_4691 [Drechslerella dactyloides]
MATAELLRGHSFAVCRVDTTILEERDASIDVTPNNNAEIETDVGVDGVSILRVIAKLGDWRPAALGYPMGWRRTAEPHMHRADAEGQPATGSGSG